MSGYTKGPWKIGTPPPNGEQTIGTEMGLMVAVATTGVGMPTVDNARLIAAAPDLLDALQISRNYVEAVYLNTPNPKKARNYSQCLDIIDAAIAKATGGSK